MTAPTMYVFEVMLKPYPAHPHLITATTAGKAKYQVYLDVSELFDSFERFLHGVESVRKVGTTVPLEASAVKNFDRVCEARNVQFAHLGMNVNVAGRKGTIVGVNESANLDVLFEDGTIGNCHPRWNITYFNATGGVIAQFGTG